MVSAFSPNIQLEEPARGDQVGTWDTPVNNNMTLIDKVVGAITTISLNNSNVVLSSPQYQSKTIVFNSTLTGSVIITFPTSFIKTYEIYNTCTGTSAFTITLQTTSGGLVICAPPGTICDVLNDGSNLRFKNFGGPIGSYFDYGGSSVPNWVAGCTTKPYLNCDGTTFSAATYPALATILGSTTLPDRRGTAGFTLNQGTGRLTTALGGLDGDTVRSLKTTQTTIATSNLPAYTPAGTITGTASAGFDAFNVAGGAGSNLYRFGGTLSSAPFNLFASFTGTPQGGVSNVLPVHSATVTGIVMIRSA